MDTVGKLSARSCFLEFRLTVGMAQPDWLDCPAQPAPSPAQPAWLVSRPSQLPCPASCIKGWACLLFAKCKLSCMGVGPPSPPLNARRGHLALLHFRAAPPPPSRCKCKCKCKCKDQPSGFLFDRSRAPKTQF